MRTCLSSVLLFGGFAGVAAAQPATGIVPPPGVPPTFKPVSNEPAVPSTPQVVPAIYIAPIVPPGFRLLAEPAVQADIGLTAVQKAAAEMVRQGWAVPAGGMSLGQFGFVPGDVLRAAADRRTADFLATGLTKEQRRRLDQILFQLREKEFGRPLAFAMAARDLGLRADQVEDVFNLKALRVEEIEKAVTSGKRFERVKGEVEAANGDTFEKMAEMLTRTQRERLKEMRGKPFTGKVEMKDALAKTTPHRYPVECFGFLDLELRYLAAPTVREGLKLSDEQTTKVLAALAEWNKRFRYPSLALSWIHELHEPTEKVLSDVLTPSQRTRFDQIMMQRRAVVSPEAMCGHPAAIAALKLSPIQLRQLKQGLQLSDVLTKEQTVAREQLLGKPFELPADVDDPYLRGAIKIAALSVEPPLAQARDFLRLTDRLKLTDEQIKKLRELAEDEPKIRELIRKELALDDTPPVAGAGRAQTTVNVVTERYRAAVERQCWEVLDEPQRSIARKIFGRGGRN